MGELSANYGVNVGGVSQNFIVNKFWKLEGTLRPNMELLGWLSPAS